MYTSKPGFSAALSDNQRTSLGKDSDVVGISSNRTLSIPRSVESGAKASEQPAQIIPTGVRRIGGLASPTAKIDGIDERVNADVAILDTGLDRKHPDLNVAGGADCTNERKFKPSFDDWNVDFGHGTFVGGIVGALDNAIGVVGAAPGARLWGVRVLDANGGGSVASLLCGIDWVTVHAATIEVANMSLSGRITEEIGCEPTPRGNDPIHTYICRSVAAGVTYVAAAGNDSLDTDLEIPATYEQVIAVSAIADFDGRPGGLAGTQPICTPDEPGERDDTFAFFSNFGQDIDISAPGVCIDSIRPGWDLQRGRRNELLRALCRGRGGSLQGQEPVRITAQVRQALISRREKGPIPDDPDRYNEGILNVAGL